MGYFYDREMGVRWINIIFVVILILVLFFMYKPFVEKFKYDKGDYYCEVSYCSKTTLDHFDKCVDLGRESVGFLSSNHYYLCDGIKVTKVCLEYGMKEFEGENLLFTYGRGLKCEDAGI